MITCDLVGRLGNQAFQLAAAYAHALRWGFEFRPPAKSVSHIFPTYFRPHGFKVFNPNTVIRRYNEEGHEYKEIPRTDNIKLVGYFQSEKYFIGYSEEVLRMLELNFHTYICGTVGIHVRRGDYVTYSDKHPPVTLDYIYSAMDHFDGTEKVFRIFSDDLKWCERNIVARNPMHKIELCDYPAPLVAIKQMAQCEHNIIANSTFSWWAAYANPNPNKTVIAPSRWFGPGNGHLEERDIIPSRWIKI